MLLEAEAGLIALVKASPLASRLRVIDALPAADGDNLVKVMAANAPAVYFSLGDFQVKDSNATLKIGAICVVRNAGGQVVARQGQLQQIGLYALMDAVGGLLDNATAGGASWRVTGGDFVGSDTIEKNGLTVGVIRAETIGAAILPPALDETSLEDFEIFNADYDTQPHVGPEQHAKWLQTPPDHSESKPELTDTVQLQP